MAKIHGLIFIIVGLLTSIVSYLIGDGMILFIFVGIGFVAFGAVRLFVNSGKLKDNDEIKREIVERRMDPRYNNAGDRYNQMVNHQKNIYPRDNHQNNHYVNSNQRPNPYYNRNPAVNHAQNNSMNHIVNNNSHPLNNNYNHSLNDGVHKINPDNHRIYNR